MATSTPGVTGAELIETSSVQYNGQTYQAWGLGMHTLYSYRLRTGRWFTAADSRRGRPHSSAGGARPRGRTTPPAPGSGMSSPSTMAAGPTRVRVIGIDTGEINAGQIVYFPSEALERLDGTPGAGNSIWFTTASSNHALINRATTAAANRLDAAGYPVSTTEIYVAQAQLTAADTSILTIVQILGLVVVAITLIGLASTLTMGVIERTREVGILRCIGARARQIRRVFSRRGACSWPPPAGRPESCSAG